MKKTITILLLISLSIAGFAQDITGYWKGKLNVSGTELEICFDIVNDATGYIVKMDIPSQGARYIPVDEASFEMMTLKLKINKLNVTYEGKLLMNSIIGEFQQSGIKFPLNLTKGEKEVTLRPQNPKEPYPYKSEEVKFKNMKEGITLAGTITIPAGNGPFPAVVLISGSGTQNRDEELMGHKPFLVISDYLTRNGIAVLRYDDRGSGESEMSAEPGTTMDLSYDAEAAFDYLKSRVDINKSKIGLIGHSEGGIIDFIIASRRSDVSFIIALAGPSVRGDKLLSAQQKKMLENQGAPAQYVNSITNMYDKIYSEIEKYDEITPELQSNLESILSSSGMPQATIKQTVGAFIEPWMFYFLKYDPNEVIINTQCPALLLNGTKDQQVVASQNLPVYKNIAAENGKKNMEIRELEGLNHLFQNCKTGSISEYMTIEETISENVLEIIKNWILTI